MKQLKNSYFFCFFPFANIFQDTYPNLVYLPASKYVVIFVVLRFKG